MNIPTGTATKQQLANGGMGGGVSNCLMLAVKVARLIKINSIILDTNLAVILNLDAGVRAVDARPRNLMCEGKTERIVGWHFAM